VIDLSSLVGLYWTIIDQFTPLFCSIPSMFHYHLKTWLISQSFHLVCSPLDVSYFIWSVDLASMFNLIVIIKASSFMFKSLHWLHGLMIVYYQCMGISLRCYTSMAFAGTFKLIILWYCNTFIFRILLFFIGMYHLIFMSKS